VSVYPVSQSVNDVTSNALMKQQHLGNSEDKLRKCDQRNNGNLQKSRHLDGRSTVADRETVHSDTTDFMTSDQLSYGATAHATDDGSDPIQKVTANHLSTSV
jgi:hypothetical protein